MNESDSDDDHGPPPPKERRLFTYDGKTYGKTHYYRLKSKERKEEEEKYTAEFKKVRDEEVSVRTIRVGIKFLVLSCFFSLLYTIILKSVNFIIIFVLNFVSSKFSSHF